VIALHALQGCIMECGCEVCDVLRVSPFSSPRRSDEEDREAQPPQSLICDCEISPPFYEASNIKIK
jgi:hypothetical protein